MDAQTRRRERRAEKQAQWKAANPLLVGVSAKPVSRIEPGTTARIATKGDLMIVMFRQERAEKGESA